uniref:Uncharacterized protein n=1 Tax=Musa acuminata subsp. malaccensis TaxID=214687 RepID=A0A804L7C8_MUSAM
MFVTIWLIIWLVMYMLNSGMRMMLQIY